MLKKEERLESIWHFLESFTQQAYSQGLNAGLGAPERRSRFLPLWWPLWPSGSAAPTEPAPWLHRWSGLCSQQNASEMSHCDWFHNCFPDWWQTPHLLCSAISQASATRAIKVSLLIDTTLGWPPSENLCWHISMHLNFVISFPHGSLNAYHEVYWDINGGLWGSIRQCSGCVVSRQLLPERWFIPTPTVSSLGQYAGPWNTFLMGQKEKSDEVLQLWEFKIGRGFLRWH